MATRMGPDEPATIPLDKFLKLAGVVGTGGEAKLQIQGGAVQVNGETETRRGRKLKVGDIVEFAGESFSVEFEAADDSPDV